MSKGTVAGIVAATLLTLTGGFLLGNRIMSKHIFLLMVAFVAIAYMLGRLAMRKREPWLPSMMALAMIAKLAGSSLRYYVLEEIYNGSGDAGRYHNFGLVIADTWRTLSVPDMTTVAFGSEGTRFTAWVTGLFYTPYEPSMLGGFWYLTLLAFVGQLFFYLAFRTAAPSHRWKRYAILILFWPTLVYWPSSIGKEALLILFLGIGSWAAAHLYKSYQPRWLPVIAIAAFLTSMIRVHLAAVFAAAVIGAVFLESRKESAPPLHSRMLVLLVAVAAAVPLVLGVADQFGVDLAGVSAEDLDPVFSNVGDITADGGSAVTGGVIRTPLDIPAGVIKVLFRPLPTDARNLQMAVASLEGVALLGLVAWQTPSMIRNRRLLRRSPYLLYGFFFSCLFIWAWSAILNLGILARQRSLVLPLLFVLIAGMGWSDEKRMQREGKPSIDSETTTEPSRVGIGLVDSTGWTGSQITPPDRAAG